MSHVLLGGDERKLPGLRSLLWKWGVTVGELAWAQSRPTVHDCDAVVLLGNDDRSADACLGSLPDGSGGAAGPAAPLIFINVKEQVPTDLAADWMLVRRLDPDGGNLCPVLLSAFATARSLRGVTAGDRFEPEQAEADGYLHFLGHELRSPLTAIKTSLEALAGDLGNPDGEAPDQDPRQKMLAIALRNVRRLHRTVEWSQDLLAAAGVADTFTPRLVAVREVATRLEAVAPVRLPDSTEDIALHTDPDVLATVVAQMSRAVGMAEPNCELLVSLEMPTGAAGQVQVAVVAGPVDPGAAAAPERSRLVSEVTVPDRHGDLSRLANFLVAPDLVGALAARLHARSTGDGCPSLVLILDPAPQPLSV